VEIGGSQFKANLDKKLARPYLKEQAGHIVYACNPSYEGKERQFNARPWQKQLSEKNN
jgi:hypothetical protein